MWTKMSLEPSRRQVAIAAQVKDAQTDRAIARASIAMTAMPREFQEQVDLLDELYGANWRKRLDQTRTDADGYFYFLDLPIGDYTLSIALPGVGTRYGDAEVQISVSEDAKGAIAKIYLQPTSITGTVTAGSNNRALVMAKVQVEGSGEYTFSDSEGNYCLTGLESGRRKIKISSVGYSSKVEEMVLNQGQMHPKDISLTQAA